MPLDYLALSLLILYGKRLIRGMREKKKKSLDNVIIYQLPTTAKIAALASAIGLSLFSIAGLIISVIDYEREDFLMSLLVCLLFAIYDVYIYFVVFKTYLRLDLNSNEFVIREFPGFNEQIIRVNHLKQITIENDVKRSIFYIVIYSQGGVKKIDSWSMGTPGFKLLFNNNARQIQRLEEFFSQCNDYLTKSN